MLWVKFVEPNGLCYYIPRECLDLSRLPLSEWPKFAEPEPPHPKINGPDE